MPDEEDLDPAEELARIQRRGLFRNLQGASATWISVLVFLLVAGPIAGVLISIGLMIDESGRFGMVFMHLLGRYWVYISLAFAAAVGGGAAAFVRRRIEPKHPEDE